MQNSGQSKKARAKQGIRLRHYLIALVLLAVVFFYVGQNHIVWRLGYEVSQLEEHKEKIAVENRNLVSKLEMLESLKRIEKVAVELEMGYPSGGQIVFIEPSQNGDLK